MTLDLDLPLQRFTPGKDPIQASVTLQVNGRREITSTFEIIDEGGWGSDLTLTGPNRPKTPDTPGRKAFYDNIQIFERALDQ